MDNFLKFMQKPLFIKIYLPVSKLDITPSVKRFFNRLRNQIIEVEFSQIRHRNSYCYKIENAEAFERYFLRGHGSKKGFTLTLTKYL